VSAKLQTVHVRVNDAATGQPTPCRVKFLGQDVTYYAPLGRPTEFATEDGEDVGGSVHIKRRGRWAYINGTCEIQLPAEPIDVSIEKGFEYRPIAKQIDLKPGQLSIRLSLERWHDARKDGWYSGDIHAEYLTPHTALLEAAAEDLTVVNLLAKSAYVLTSERSNRFSFPNIDAFSGQRPALESPGHMVVVNTLNRHEELGELVLLNCHRVVYPLSFGAPLGPDNWTLADWCDQCHRKGGLVVSDGIGGLAELILGKVDACKAFIENQEDWFILSPYERLIQIGFRIPLVAGSKKRSNARALGSFRTYARLQQDEALTYRAWIEAVRAGRTFISNGPLLYLTVNGQDPGSVVKLEAPGQKVHVHAEVHCRFPMQRLGVYLPGRERLSIDMDESQERLAIDRELPMDCSGTISASCIGQTQHVATSPIYVEVAGGRTPDHVCASRTADAKDLLKDLEEKVSWINTRACFENDHQRERLIGIFLAAKEELARRARG
jgi:hypothetical protein